MSASDDDVMVIALWIISIGFIILAISKTVGLNNEPCKEDGGNGTKLVPPVPTPVPQTSAVQADNKQAEDEQYTQIQKQLQQLSSGISALKEKLQ
ncbi:hypothetical protein [Brevibacillus dissolubilis]|uniref:hypothetical protein n=1 Tax=Brevibacillus dissolubilis TaxID=1844116 RepID=UPI001116A13D|nr:hypothetical protein [Brevibacillus dissolubilis]